MTPPTTLLPSTTARAEDGNASAPRQRLHARVSRIVIFAAVATIAVGVTVHHTTGRLGTALPPFVASWAPRAELLPALLAAAALAAAVALLPRLVAAPRVSPLAFDLIILLVALALGLAVSAAREGTHGWWAIFDLGRGGSFEARNEYLPGLSALSYGPHVYLDRFAEIVPSQPVNVAGHPPGPLLLMDLLGIRTAQGLAALCVVAAAACAPLAHRLGRALDGERAGRVAAALCALAPIVLLFGFTSYDAVFAAAGTAAAVLLVTPRTRALGAIALALGALLSWALLGVGAWTAVVVWRREGARAALWLAATAAAALLALNIILVVTTGYDPIGTLRATEQVYRASVSRQRPLWFWAFGSPVAWGVLLGPPIVALALRSATAARATGLATAIVVAVAAGGGFTKAETERIWLFLVPLACVAAAPHVRRLGPLLAALAAQALALQLLTGTVW
jgi:methylthioxylose transferase